LLYLFDVDGTLRRPILLPAIGSLAPWDQRVLPGRAQRLQALKAEGHRIGAATNQPAVAFGLISEARMRKGLDELNRRLGGVLEWIGVCPDHPLGVVPRYRVQCGCRKPQPDLLLQALAFFAVPASQATYIGDRVTDEQAARVAGYEFIPADHFFRAMLNPWTSTPSK
jgi:D-glycero-D-manno-heptose 1,7-bisphosphate phosphatase